MTNRKLLDLRIVMMESNVKKIKEELAKDQPNEDEIERRLDLVVMDADKMLKTLE